MVSFCPGVLPGVDLQTAVMLPKGELVPRPVDIAGAPTVDHYGEAIGSKVGYAAAVGVAVEVEGDLGELFDEAL